MARALFLQLLAAAGLDPFIPEKALGRVKVL
jgi:hypothetical protein